MENLQASIVPHFTELQVSLLPSVHIFDFEKGSGLLQLWGEWGKIHKIVVRSCGFQS